MVVYFVTFFTIISAIDIINTFLVLLRKNMIFVIHSVEHDFISSLYNGTQKLKNEAYFCFLNPLLPSAAFMRRSAKIFILI